MTSLSFLSRKLHTRKFFQISVPGKTLLLLQQASSLLITRALQFFMLSEAWNPKSVLQLCHCNYGKHTATGFSIAPFALVIFYIYNIDSDFYYKLFKNLLVKKREGSMMHAILQSTMHACISSHLGRWLLEPRHSRPAYLKAGIWVICVI